MKHLTAIVLCNDVIALPALMTLSFYRQLKAVGIPGKNAELIHEARASLPADIMIVELNKSAWKEQVQDLFRSTGAELGFLMTFPWKLDRSTISIPENGFFNFHYGLLPEYRGADPLFYQVKNQEAFAGLTVHRVEEKMDEGEILIQERIKMDPAMTYGWLKLKLSGLGAGMTVKCMEILQFSERIITRPQVTAKARWYDRPGKKEVMIDWLGMSADDIIALANACNPWNKGAGTIINGIGIRIIEAEKLPNKLTEKLIPGQINFLNSEMLIVAARDEAQLALKIIFTPEGFMSATRLSDYGVKQGDIFDHNH